MAVPDEIQAGDIEVRPHEHSVCIRGDEVPLTSREFDIIRMLAEHPGWVLSADQLAGESGEGDYSPESVSVLVSRLRQKLAAAGASDVVETVRGLGYRLHRSTALGDESASYATVRSELRDACWLLHEAVIEIEHSGTLEQQMDAIDELIRARHTIYARLAR